MGDGVHHWSTPGGEGWSAGLVTSLTWTAEEPIGTLSHRQQTACWTSSAGRSSSFTANDALLVMPVARLEPLSSRARPLEAWRARGRPRQPPWLRARSSFRGPCVKGLLTIIFCASPNLHTLFRASPHPQMNLWWRHLIYKKSSNLTLSHLTVNSMLINC